MTSTTWRICSKVCDATCKSTVTTSAMISMWVFTATGREGYSLTALASSPER